MNRALELTTHILVATLLAIKLVDIVLGVKFRSRFLRQLAAEPEGRVRFYRNFILVSWVTAAFVPAIAFASADLSATDLGWAWPSGDGLDYLLASYVLLLIGVGGLRARSRMRRGHVLPGRAGTAPLVPQNTRERRLAILVSVTAGVTEEAVFRGLFIGVGTQLYDLPLALVVLASLALFVAAHAYQGRRGLLGITLIGSMFTAVYLVSGSLLLAIVVHLCQDLVALLLVPAHPTVPEPTANSGTGSHGTGSPGTGSHGTGSPGTGTHGTGAVGEAGGNERDTQVTTTDNVTPTEQVAVQPAVLPGVRAPFPG
ncbi:CPBP family intramembrane metalloprotease [Plantactinospora sp. S1510]|uniref:CPBP family intramembrane metalloprotease n=1 Tax=Plantactinospora alkalitolerans TaxID=2789879 RepID=A0ABS0GSF3_9ACTN|nr:type II CAAX endopeptidase family protein [Plantactinospora alkalitolerans]MBF9128817.1 CPBP family intramembrane metalloprotease [Plantactinospora alkalitolerans]